MNWLIYFSKMVNMTKHTMNPIRDKIIIDMKNGDEWYINNQSLWYDIVDNVTKEAIYVLLHMSPVSTTLNESDDPDFDFTIKISCTIENEQQVFTIHDNPHYTYINIDVLPKRAYTILYQGTKDIIKNFDASREEFNDNKFYENVYNFIEILLEQDEDDGSKDQIYRDAWSNFAENITDIAPFYSREQIENCLKSLAIVSQQDHDTLLAQLSDYNACKKWIASMCNDNVIKGYLEPSLQKNLDTIAWFFYECYVKQETTVHVENVSESVEISKEQTLQDLQKEFDKALQEEDYDKVEELSKKIKQYKQ